MGAMNYRLRIAMLFSGRVKSYEDSGWLKDLIAARQIDCYASLNCDYDDYQQRFLEWFRVKRHRFEHFVLPPQYDAMHSHKAPETPLYNACAMFYHRQCAYGLLLDAAPARPYDLIVSMRADILTERTLDFEHIIDSSLAGPRDIFIPASADYGGLNDQLAFGNYPVMTVYCNLYASLPHYHQHDGVRFHPETMLAHHLKVNSCIVRRFDFPYQLNPNRF